MNKIDVKEEQVIELFNVLQRQRQIKIIPAILDAVENQTEAICLAAVRLNGMALQFARKQTSEICQIALSNNPWVLQYVKEQDEKMCLSAVKQNALVLRHVKKQTNKICWIALRDRSWTLEHIDKKLQTPKMCSFAMDENIDNFQYVHNKTEDMCLYAVEDWAELIKYIENPSEKVCLAALRYDGSILQYIKNQTLEICLAAVKNYGMALEYVIAKYHTTEVLLEAVRQNPMAIQYTVNPSEEVCLVAVNTNGKAIDHIPEGRRTVAVCKAAITKSPETIALLKQTSELTIVFDHSRLIPARQYLDTDPLIKGVLLPADMLVNEDTEIEVEDEQIWVMRGKELRAEFTDGLTGTVYSVSFEYEKSIRFDNRLLISASVKELLQIQNRLLTPLAESPYPEWPEYAERGYCYMIDFERISPIPANLSEEQKSSWCLENWGVAGNAEETLINCLLTIDPSLSPDAEDFLDIYFETETVPLLVIRKLIAEHPKLEVEYYYYDQLAQSAGQVIVYGNGQCKEEHFTGVKECRISELGHQFGYEY